jgi:peptide/nickel transport system permease protein
VARYISGRLLQAASLVLIVSVICFVLLRLTTDPIAMYNVTQMTGEDIARIRQELGLDQPIYVQYLAWLGRAVRLDWGFSFASHRPVVAIIGERLPRSMALAGAAEVVVIVVAMGMAILAALRPYSLLDNLLTTLTFVFFSMPIFWLGLALMYIFAVYFKRWGLPYLPTGGDIWDYGDPVQWVRHLILPVICLASVSAAIAGRYLRSAMLDVINQDYVRTARAKGLNERAVLVRHVLKNASIPLVTLIGMDLPGLVAGAIVTETIFSWPGMGRAFWESINLGDYPVVMAILFLVSVVVVAAQLLVDLTYTLLDPRIRYE